MIAFPDRNQAGDGKVAFVLRKTFFLIFLLLAGCLVLSSCNLIAADISGMTKSPQLTKEQEEIQKALNTALGTKVTPVLKYPSSGKYRSSIVLKDVNQDGTEEAIVFYAMGEGIPGSNILILNKEEEQWKSMCSISAPSGYDVESIDFVSFTEDHENTLAVGWGMLGSRKKMLGIYNIDGNSANEIYSDYYYAMSISDMNRDGIKELILLNDGANDTKIRASIYSYLVKYPMDVQNSVLEAAGERTDYESFVKIGEAPMDNNVTKYLSITESSLSDGTQALFVDGLRSTGETVTELLFFKNEQLQSPLYDYARQTVTVATRPYTMLCRDIDGDNRLEIPVGLMMPGYEEKPGQEKMWLTRWYEYDPARGLQPLIMTAVNSTWDYMITFPEEWMQLFTIESMNKDKNWMFYRLDDRQEKTDVKALELIAYTEKEWSEIPNKIGLEEIARNKDIIYAVKIFDQTGMKLSLIHI